MSPLVVQDEHVVSTGVVISYAFFAVATHILLNPNSRAGSRQGQLVGYSPAGLPFYALQTDNLWGGTGTPPWVHLKNFIKQVRDSKIVSSITATICAFYHCQIIAYQPQ